MKVREDMKSKFMCDDCYTTQKKVQESDEPMPDSGFDDARAHE